MRRSVWLLPLFIWCTSTARAQQTGPDAPRVQVMGFGDVVYVATEREAAEGFLLGQAVAHVSAALTSRLAFFSEISATARPAGFGVEAERLLVRYDFADYFKLSVGRYHTPVSYWNTAFHHGLWLQTSVSRPEMIKFGSQLLPVHFVGALAEGSLPWTPLGLGYSVGVGNGRFSNIARAGDAGDVNDHRAWTAALFARPSALYGLQLGASYYADRVTPDEAAEVDEQIVSGYVVWAREHPEVIAEYARLFHEPTTAPGESATSDAYYLQLAYRLPGAAAAWKPYARVERVLVGDDDLLLQPRGLDYEAAVLGVRYDFAPLAALKAEYRREEFVGPERFNSLYLQVSLAVPALLGGGEGMDHAEP